MLNARTWHRIGVSAYVLIPGALLSISVRDDSRFLWLARAMVAWGSLVVAIGAAAGILLVLGRLTMGCPRCNAKSEVLGGNRDGLYLNCPECGTLRLKFGSPFGLRVIHCGTEGADDEADTASTLLVPWRHPISFLTTIAPASIIHKFLLVYLLVPGLWCFFVGGFVVNGIYTGRMCDNHGTVLRSKSPIRFWGKVALWAFAYLFGATFPIGYALQESRKSKVAQGTMQAPEANKP